MKWTVGAQPVAGANVFWTEGNQRYIVYDSNHLNEFPALRRGRNIGASERMQFDPKNQTTF